MSLNENAKKYIAQKVQEAREKNILDKIGGGSIEGPSYHLSCVDRKPMNVEPGRTKVRWIIAHFPLDLFIRTARAFAEELEKSCPGKFAIEVHTIGSYLQLYGDKVLPDTLDLWKKTSVSIPGLENPYNTLANLGSIQPEKAETVKEFTQLLSWWENFFNHMKNGHFELSQTQINICGSHLHPDFHAIDLPYLFENHDHVTETLDGPIGQRVSDSARELTGINALGYTYSGGYRIIGSTDEITCLNDLSDKKFISFTKPSSKFFEFAKVNHIPRYLSTAEDVGDMAENGGAIETTYLRFFGKHVLKTNHSMFMTAILGNQSFIDSLSIDEQLAFKEAAMTVARLERVWSLQDAAKWEADAKGRGVTIHNISEADDSRLRQAAKKVYDEQILEGIDVDPTLVEDIIKLGKKYYNKK